MNNNTITINTGRSTRELAILGGEPVISNNTAAMAAGPYIDEKMIESIAKTIKSGIWCRIQSPAGTVPTFEKEFAKFMGTRFSVSTGAGTQALNTCVEALGIGAGDEVITSPYTDIGTISAIVFSRALPVFADLDRESFQLDPYEVGKKVNQNTKAIIPVHIGGQPADMEHIMAIAKKHNLPVIEDACQAHLTEYQGKKLGTIGELGCFSFQASKNIACGEGGAIIGNDEALMDKCFAVMNHGTTRTGKHAVIGPKYRMNELEAALLLPQLETIKERHDKRNSNAWYMRGRLRDFPGITSQKLYEGTGTSSWWLYMASYNKESFNNAGRDKFIKALNAEGVKATSYIKYGFHKSEVIQNHILDLKVYKKFYSADRLKKYRDELSCPVCDAVCDETMITFDIPAAPDRNYLDMMFNAIVKVYENRDKLTSI